MLLMIQKVIRGGICQAVHRYAKANNYDKDITPSCKTYLDANNFYGWAMSQKLQAKNRDYQDLMRDI